MARRSDHTRDELHAMALEAAARLAGGDGLKSVTARGVAREIGYTVGTIYNVFEDLEDLVLQMNARTLEDLYAAATDGAIGATPEAALSTLGRRYLDFVAANPGRWQAIMEHQAPAGGTLPDWYRARIARLLGLAEDAVRPLFPAGDDSGPRRAAHVLWAALYGISSLAQGGNLPEGDDAGALVDALVVTYVAGLRARG